VKCTSTRSRVLRRRGFHPRGTALKLATCTPESRRTPSVDTQQGRIGPTWHSGRETSILETPDYSSFRPPSIWGSPPRCLDPIQYSTDHRQRRRTRRISTVRLASLTGSVFSLHLLLTAGDSTSRNACQDEHICPTATFVRTTGRRTLRSVMSSTSEATSRSLRSNLGRFSLFRRTLPHNSLNAPMSATRTSTGTTAMRSAASMPRQPTCEASPVEVATNFATRLDDAIQRTRRHEPGSDTTFELR